MVTGISPHRRIGAYALLAAAAAFCPTARVSGQEVRDATVPETVQRPAVEGRRIAEQNFALRYALEALQRVKPEPGRVNLYVTDRREDDLWRVYFGSLDFTSQRFMVAYEAVQATPGSREFVVTSHPRDKPADEFVSRAALALITALNAFEPPKITFYPHVFRESDGRWVTYFLPDLVPPGSMPQQVDSRVVVSPDARSVLESTRFYARISFSMGFNGETGAAARREERERAAIESFVHYYVPRMAAQPILAPVALLLNLYTCSLTPRQLAPACYR
ncbi:MAG: hypothetical protein JSV95_11245 [Gemmatimonadota bacterium]|jgi:hypothetical protein|nr:MAG: hypothetical protein JSV95_11245 [Gemmatimonadota bacterium]